MAVRCSAFARPEREGETETEGEKIVSDKSDPPLKPISFLKLVVAMSVHDRSFDLLATITAAGAASRNYPPAQARREVRLL